MEVWRAFQASGPDTLPPGVNPESGLPLTRSGMWHVIDEALDSGKTSNFSERKERSDEKTTDCDRGT